MRGARERPIDRALVPERPLVDGVARGFGVDLGSAWRLCAGGVDDGREFFVLDLNQLGGVTRLILGLGNDDSYRIAYESRHISGQRRIGCGPHRRTILRVDHPAADQATNLVLGQLRAGEHAYDTWRAERRGRVDAHDPRVGVRAADELRIGGILHRNIVGVVALAGDEAPIFLAQDPRPDALMCHVRFSPYAPALPLWATAAIAFTML